MVVVGGGPTGVEFAGELQDFFEDDIKRLVPDIADRFKVTLIEALPNVLPSFSKQLIEYTENTFKEEKIDILTKTMHKKAAVKFYEAEASSIDPERKVVMITDNSEVKGATSQTEIPYDMLVIGVGAENATFGIPG
ncbi:hypothetical protein BN1723_018778, partial [Verticillium longisporum]